MNTNKDILARTEYAKKTVETAAKTGTAQVVILNGGMDALPFDRIDGLRYFEADRPAVVTAKRLRLSKAGVEPPKNTVFVPLSKGDTLCDALCRHGFDKTKKTAFLWLGGSYIVEDEKMRELLSVIHSFCADGSTIVLDYLEAVYPKHPRDEERLFAMSYGKDITTDFTYAEFERLLENMGFLIYERLSPDDIGENALPVSFVQAVVKKNI